MWRNENYGKEVDLQRRTEKKMRKPISGLLAKAERQVFYDNLDFGTKYY